MIDDDDELEEFEDDPDLWGDARIEDEMYWDSVLED